MQAFVRLYEDSAALRAAVDSKGYAVLNSYAVPETCNHIRNFIDRFPSNNAEINYGGSEKRIWDSQNMDQAIGEFAELTEEVMQNVFGVEARVKTVLAYSNYPISDRSELILGRWHLDSLRPQYKIFCFLTKTEERTGPLEIVPGSHKAWFKLRHFLRGRYITARDMAFGGRKYQKLDESWVDKQCQKAGGSIPLLCDAGTLILVDTSAIHRARPCLDGKRYALSAYYDHF